jgi:hypothetical protein
MAIRLLKIRNVSGTFILNKTASLEYLELFSGNHLVKLGPTFITTIGIFAVITVIAT